MSKKSNAGWASKNALCRADGAEAGAHSVHTQAPHLGTYSGPRWPASCSLQPQHEAYHTCLVCSSSSLRATAEHHKKFWISSVLSEKFV